MGLDTDFHESRAVVPRVMHPNESPYTAVHSFRKNGALTTAIMREVGVMRDDGSAYTELTRNDVVKLIRLTRNSLAGRIPCLPGPECPEWQKGPTDFWGEMNGRKLREAFRVLKAIKKSIDTRGAEWYCCATW
jgi:hypothetical protein